MNLIGVGVDIEKVNRFKNKSLENSANFLNSIFTENEINYSFSDKKSPQHLCARFCAKEAVIKALSDFNITDVSCKEIEILNNDNGAPYIKLDKYKEFNIKVSISHTKTDAIAFVIIQKENY